MNIRGAEAVATWGSRKGAQELAVQERVPIQMAALLSPAKGEQGTLREFLVTTAGGGGGSFLKVTTDRGKEPPRPKQQVPRAHRAAVGFQGSWGAPGPSEGQRRSGFSHSIQSGGAHTWPVATDAVTEGAWPHRHEAR